jgi:hypothetical protein
MFTLIVKGESQAIRRSRFAPDQKLRAPYEIAIIVLFWSVEILDRS